MPGQKGKGRSLIKFVEENGSGVLNIVTPAGVGVLTGAVLAGLCLPGPPAILPDVVPDRLYAALVGLALGYGASRGLAWLRQATLKSLFTYTGWIYNRRSWKTKLWAVLVKLLRGPGPHHTLAFQPLLPHQPLPDLNQTLDRWLSVLEPLLTPAEHAAAWEVVEQFRKNEGPQLQAYLQKRAGEKLNWLSEYWLTAAYLTGRNPIAVNSNFYSCNQLPKEVVDDPLNRAAQVAFHCCQMDQHIMAGNLSPSCLQELVPLCMSGAQFLFNSCRLPGEYMDMLVKEPSGNKHIIVIRKGHYYQLDAYTANRNNTERLLTQQELRNQLAQIQAEADSLEKPLPVAVLTSQNRTLWWKQRQQLGLKNKKTLALVEDALFVLVLDEYYPKNKDEHASRLLTGAGHDRWFDKSLNTVIFEDASGGANVEHSVIDATVMSQLFEYCLYNEAYVDGKLIPDPIHAPRDLTMPRRLTWDLTGLVDAIQTAMVSFNELSGNLNVKILCTQYGREFMKKSRNSPDAYIQMSLQLAYYRMHKKIVKTYEPSTGRLFSLGRTETVHPVSASSVAWVKSMDDPNVPTEKRIALLQAASKYQTAYRLDATVGQGCDRHLLGLYCASRELGMDVPALFRDKGWQSPFTLSTSQTPTRLSELGVPVDLDHCGGGFAPSDEDGYGIAYIHVGDDQINIHVSSWNSCSSTSSERLVQTLDQVLADMKHMFI